LDIPQPQIDGPAGGSDFESFIYTMGTPVLDIGYTGSFGTYHSPYDDYRYASLYADPGFRHHRTIAQTIGVIAMRLADAHALPFRFAAYDKPLDAGAATVAKAAAGAKLTIDPALGAAIARFENAARGYDAEKAPQGNVHALEAAQQLDLMVYSANGYASVAFPRITAAIASHNQDALTNAVKSTVTTLDEVTALLS
jgi:hypothetical protein